MKHLILTLAILLSGCYEDDTIYTAVEPNMIKVSECPSDEVPTWQGANNYYWVKVKYEITNGVVTQEHVTDCLKVY